MYLGKRATKSVDMSRKRIYNRVTASTDVCPKGELLTDKELERMKTYNMRRDWPNTVKVKVPAEKIYFSFGVRFTTEYELI